MTLFVDCESAPHGDPPTDPAEFDAWAALALRPGSARIVCMSYATDEGDVRTVQTMSDINAVLWTHRDHQWVAHGGRRYDFPLSYANLVRSGATSGAARVLAKRLNAKPWESPLVDTAQLGGAWIRLAEFCEMHGVPGKTDDIGARVWQVWREDPARVVSYCEGDAVALRAAYQRYLEILGA